MLIPASVTTGVALQSWETALALRGMALLQPDLPKYLLAPEVAVCSAALTMSVSECCLLFCGTPMRASQRR